MNRDKVKGRMREIVGAIEEGWGRLIGDQTLQFRGERARWLGRMQVGYGIHQERGYGFHHDTRRYRPQRERVGAIERPGF